MADRVFTYNINYEPEAISLFSRMSSQPDARRKAIINETIFQLKFYGIWSELDVIYFIAAADSQVAKLNWKSSSFNLSELGTMKFVIDRGYTRNGGAGGGGDALDTGYVPSTNGIKALLNTNSFGIYVRTNPNEGAADMGTQTSGSIGSQINCRNGGNMQIKNNSIASLSVTVADSLGLSSVVRSTSSFITAYKNGSPIKTASVASSSLSNFSLYLNAVNKENSIIGGSGKQSAFAYVGSANIDQLKLYNIVQFYMNCIGAAV